MPEFYMRRLPESCVDFGSQEGRALFESALASGGLEIFFALMPQFQTQNEPAYCGLATLAMCLNTLRVDPGRIWKGVWRWYDESLLDCCKDLNDVQREGITLEEFVCLGKCNGVDMASHRVEAYCLDTFSTLREVIRDSCGRTDAVVAATYSRKTLGQSGDGHFSPIGGYDARSDMVLLLDVARFKYPPHWVPLPLLYEAMLRHDNATGKPRGWVLVTKAAASHTCAHCDQEAAVKALDRITDGNIQQALRAPLPPKTETLTPRALRLGLAVAIACVAALALRRPTCRG